MAETFYFPNGATASNKKELIKELKKLDQENFRHHVDGVKNDFAIYVEKSLKDKKLAGQIRPMLLKKDIIHKLEESIKEPKKAKKKVKKKASTKKASVKKTPAKKVAKKVSTKTTSSKTTAKPKEERVNYEEILLHKPSKQYNSVSYISSEAPHLFILKEFLFGALFGLLLGLILMAMLFRAGVYV